MPPIHEFECPRGHRFERIRPFSEAGMFALCIENITAEARRTENTPTSTVVYAACAQYARQVPSVPAVAVVPDGTGAMSQPGT